MITLDKTTMVLQAKINANPASANPQVNIVFYDENMQAQDTKYGSQQASLSTSADVTICNAPAQNFIRNIEAVYFHNKDNAPTDVTIKIDDGGSETILFRASLSSLECAYYEHGRGFFCTTNAGARK